jgi:two-component system NtrC family sensor kinase
MKLPHAQEALEYFEKIESQFGQMQEGLDHLQRLATLGTLSAMVAHEFNNILTPVIGYTQMALAKPDDHDLSRKALEKALAGAEHAAHIASSLLDFSREEDSSAQASLSQAVHSALGCLARGLESDGIELTLKLQDVQVAMPQISLEQVLLNLILNARNAMAQGGGTLTIHAWLSEKTVHIDLADTGGGISPQIAARLFEPFITHDSAPGNKVEKGTGLGLSVCKNLITNAGGQLNFDSTPGQGTTFHLLIPQAQPLRRSA